MSCSDSMMIVFVNVFFLNKTFVSVNKRNIDTTIPNIRTTTIYHENILSFIGITFEKNIQQEKQYHKNTK